MQDELVGAVKFALNGPRWAAKARHHASIQVAVGVFSQFQRAGSNNALFVFAK
jgi:hypothetical protein